MTINLQARIDPIITPRGTRYVITMASGAEIKEDKQGNEFEWMTTAKLFAEEFGIEVYNV